MGSILDIYLGNDGRRFNLSARRGTRVVEMQEVAPDRDQGIETFH